MRFVRLTNRQDLRVAIRADLIMSLVEHPVNVIDPGKRDRTEIWTIVEHGEFGQTKPSTTPVKESIEEILRQIHAAEPGESVEEIMRQIHLLEGEDK